jgi:hypothetical protein
MRAAVIAAVIAAVLAALASPVLAQPSLTPPSATSFEPAPPHSEAKSETAATTLALAGTAVPILVFFSSINRNESGVSGPGLLLAFGGAIFLPSAGHWYAGKAAPAGLWIRVAGGTVAGFALLGLMGSDDDASGLEKVFFAGAGTMGVGALYDIATAGSAVAEWNRKHVELRPTVTRLGDGYGVGLAGRF